jgi:hypothetical protein
MRHPQRRQNADRWRSLCLGALHSAAGFPALRRAHPLNRRSCGPPIFIRGEIIAGKNFKSEENLKMEKNLPVKCDKLTKLAAWFFAAFFCMLASVAQHDWRARGSGAHLAVWSIRC